MTQDDITLTKIARETVDGLTSWRDQVRVKIHLASLDAKEAWKAAETHVDLAQGRLKTVLETTVPTGAGQVRTDLRVALHDARKTLGKIAPNLDAIGHDLAKAGREILTRLDRDVGSEPKA